MQSSGLRTGIASKYCGRARSGDCTFMMFHSLCLPSSSVFLMHEANGVQARCHTAVADAGIRGPLPAKLQSITLARQWPIARRHVDRKHPLRSAASSAASSPSASTSRGPADEGQHPQRTSSAVVSVVLSAFAAMWSGLVEAVRSAAAQARFTCTGADVRAPTSQLVVATLCCQCMLAASCKAMSCAAQSLCRGQAMQTQVVDAG